jgi:hypothetical protein
MHFFARTAVHGEAYLARSNWIQLGDELAQNSLSSKRQPGRVARPGPSQSGFSEWPRKLEDIRMFLQATHACVVVFQLLAALTVSRMSI